MVITIGRECGCAGDEIGKALADKYQIPCYARKEMIALAKQKHLYEKYPFFFGEMPADAMLHSVAEDFAERLYATPGKALGALFEGKDCIVIGRASDYAFRDREDAVSIFLCGDKKERIKRMMKKHDISERKAKVMVEDTDRRRRTYHNYYSGEEWGYAGNYDLCLNAVDLGVDGVVQMVDTYMQICKKG